MGQTYKTYLTALHRMLHYCQVFWFGVRRVWCGLPSVPGFHLARVHGPKQKDELEITTQINPVLHVIFNGATCPILMFSCGFFFVPLDSCYVLTSEMMWKKLSTTGKKWWRWYTSTFQFESRSTSWWTTMGAPAFLDSKNGDRRWKLE